jgi:flagellar assembly protein FliH
LSKVIKSFYNRTDQQAEKNGVVIGLQPITVPTIDNAFDEMDAESITQHIKTERVRILEEAHAEAARIKEEAEQLQRHHEDRLAVEEEQWRHKMDEEMALAKKKGYEAGFENGMHQGLGNWRSKLEEATAVINKTKEDYHLVIEEAEPQIVLMAIKTAEKIIGQKLGESPETWVSIVKQLVKEAREFEEVKLYVPTGWFDLTLEYRDELRNMLQSTASLFIYPDENLKDNGAVIEFPFGKIDAALDVQLKEIREKLLEQIEVSENER